MYGLVNQAVRQMVLCEHGQNAWEAIRRKAAVEDDDFVAMQQYPDEQTYDLVAAASEALGAPAEAVLREFGHYWVRYVADSGYGDLMKAAGRSLREFLTNLDHLHARVGLTFPALRPPEFTVIEDSQARIRLEYRSPREGLAPFVIGLVEGLAERFDERVVVSLIGPRSEGRDHDEFLIEFTEMKPA